MKRPNIKLMNSVHTEARIKANSTILQILNDVNSFDYFTHRMIEALRMAQTDRANADQHLCLVTQLATITRTKLREEALAKQLEHSKEVAEHYMDPLNHPG